MKRLELTEDPSLHRVVTAALDAWGHPLAPEQITIETSTRMRRALGKCYPGRGLVRLRADVLQAKEQIRDEVVCHELAHLVAYCAFGPRIRPHGGEWQALMLAAGFEPRAMLPANADDGLAPQLEPPRYLHECHRCGAHRVARRRVTRWRCGRCLRAGRGGELAISRIP